MSSPPLRVLTEQHRRRLPQCRRHRGGSVHRRSVGGRGDRGAQVGQEIGVGIAIGEVDGVRGSGEFTAGVEPVGDHRSATAAGVGGAHRDELPVRSGHGVAVDSQLGCEFTDRRQ
ncbi:hypothetical protein [Gordonia sp. SMJS1]|uniref:hypothetical protein n=1 Tax=Gordonia sp. SMJS1 TaxID=3039400 RepID=UPI0032AEEB84